MECLFEWNAKSLSSPQVLMVLKILKRRLRWSLRDKKHCKAQFNFNEITCPCEKLFSSSTLRTLYVWWLLKCKGRRRTWDTCTSFLHSIFFNFQYSRLPPQLKHAKDSSARAHSKWSLEFGVTSLKELTSGETSMKNWTILTDVNCLQQNRITNVDAMWLHACTKGEKEIRYAILP